jgi:hypothetical protein
MEKLVKKWGFLYIVLSAATIIGAYALFKAGHPILAADVIVISPFPCPPGLPC